MVMGIGLAWLEAGKELITIRVPTVLVHRACFHWEIAPQRGEGEKREGVQSLKQSTQEFLAQGLRAPLYIWESLLECAKFVCRPYSSIYSRKFCLCIVLQLSALVDGRTSHLSSPSRGGKLLRSPATGD